MTRFHWILILICIPALIIRVFSTHWNVIPHGDITGDATAAAALITDGMLLASHNPDVSSQPHFFPPGIERNLLVAHPPIWALLGAGVLVLSRWEPSFANAFFALKLLSVLSGIVIIFISAFIARRRFGDTASLFIALWLSCSYLMIDYSGNGALYSLQAVTYLVWISVAYVQSKYRPITLGAVSGIGYLVNHQSVVLALASVVVLLCTNRTWKQKILDLFIVTIVTFVSTAPWLIRNYIVYDNLFFSHVVNSTYVYVKTAMPREIIDGREYFIVGLQGRIAILHSIITLWIPNNTYYIARKLFILAPILFFFFSFAWVDYLFSKKRLKAMLPILTLFVIHLFISAAWPVTKFRYFVPMLPLVFFIGMDQLQHVRFDARTRNCFFAAITVSIVILSYLTFLSVPTHTYYYDGAVTNDPFHGRGEYEFMKKRGYIPYL